MIGSFPCRHRVPATQTQPTTHTHTHTRVVGISAAGLQVTGCNRLYTASLFRAQELCESRSGCPEPLIVSSDPYGLYGRKATLKKEEEAHLFTAQELCERRGGRPRLHVRSVSVDVKQHWTSSALTTAGFARKLISKSRGSSVQYYPTSATTVFVVFSWAVFEPAIAFINLLPMVGWFHRHEVTVAEPFI